MITTPAFMVLILKARKRELLKVGRQRVNLVQNVAGRQTALKPLLAGLAEQAVHLLTKRKVPAFLGSSFAFFPTATLVSLAALLPVPHARLHRWTDGEVAL